MELAEAVCEQLGYTPVFQYIVWDKKDEYLDNGKVDCLWGSFTMNGRAVGPEQQKPDRVDKMQDQGTGQYHEENEASGDPVFGGQH